VAKFLSAEFRRDIQNRLHWLKEQESRLHHAPGTLSSLEKMTELGRLQGNIGALEWVLREADLKAAANRA
jgi:hypothetical protein